MRILFCGVAAFALSGCSWIANTHTHSHKTSQYGGQYSGSRYSSPKIRKPSKLSLTGSLGTDLPIGGHAITGNETLFSGTTQVHKVSMQDAYKLGWRADLGGAYALGKNNEVLVNGFYQKASGKDRTIGAHTSGKALEGRMSNYKAFGIETGLRHRMNKTKLPLIKSVTPYVEGRVGLAKIGEMALEDVRVDGEIASRDYAFYKGGWVPTMSGMIGFEKPISRKASLGVETGIRYIGGVGADNTDTAGSFLENSNNGSSRWSVPIQLRGRYKF